MGKYTLADKVVDDLRSIGDIASAAKANLDMMLEMAATKGAADALAYYEGTIRKCLDRINTVSEKARTSARVLRDDC